MRLATIAQMQELDRKTIEESGTPGEVLMDRAGCGVAAVVRQAAELAGKTSEPVMLLAGRGNNGGDVFAAARYLHTWGFETQVCLACGAGAIKGDALIHLDRMKQAGVPCREFPTKEDWEQITPLETPPAILVDGLLGTGASGTPREPISSAISFIEKQSSLALVVAVDIPSGVNGDTGEVAGAAVVADITVTMGCPKSGLVESLALPYVGVVRVVNIGIPDEYVTQENFEADRELLCAADLADLFPRRPRDAHKGLYGHVLLIGGARGYAGAIAMAARAATRSGAGLVTVMVPESIVPIVASSALEAMVVGVEETPEGSISDSILTNWRARSGDFDAVLVGPGMTMHAATRSVVSALLQECSVPVIVDADAINVLVGKTLELQSACGPVAITPHPGELGRLLGCKTVAIQSDRCGKALQTVEATGAIVVLKGAGTIVAANAQPLFINLTGNPGMATGGSGDVLAGLVAGLAGQGLELFDAAKAAVYLHGRAGDIAALRKTQPALAATDLIEEIPSAFRELSL